MSSQANDSHSCVLMTFIPCRFAISENFPVEKVLLLVDNNNSRQFRAQRGGGREGVYERK